MIPHFFVIVILFLPGCQSPEKKNFPMTSQNKYQNRLIHEKSPYLLQHADNPVAWYPWSEEAFQKAKDKVRDPELEAWESLPNENDEEEWTWK